MRVMAMLIIILFHSLCFYTHRWWVFGGEYILFWDKIASFLDSVGLPMFIFISGYLFGFSNTEKKKYQNKNAIIKAKAKRLMLPYLFWGFFLIITMPSINEWKDMMTGISHLWFLLVLFEIFMITIPIVNWLCQKAECWQFIGVILSSYILFFLYHTLSPHHAIFAIHTTLNYLPFFFMGIACYRFKITQKIDTLGAKITLVISLSILALYTYGSSISSFIINTLSIHILGASIAMSLLIILNNTNYHRKSYYIVGHFDKLSMDIYILNQIIINALLLTNGVVPFLNIHYKTGPLIIFITGFLIPWGGAYIIDKIKHSISHFKQ